MTSNIHHIIPQMDIDYSIAIRTLGYGGTKYKELLQSIDCQTVKPQNVFIFIPYNYNLPQEVLGYEKFIRVEKGMVKQRVAAIEYVQEKYILLLDDDVSFPENFVEALFYSLINSNADVCVSQMIDYATKKYLGFKAYAWRIKQFLLGKNKFANKDDGFSQKIWRTGGVIYLKKKDLNKTYLLQTGHGSHCFAKTMALKSIHFEEELWLEDSSYCLPDDQVMFFKLFCYQYKITQSFKTILTHLDGAKKSNRKETASYAEGRNYFIFWHRFIYKRDKAIKDKFLDIFAISLRITTNFLYHLSKRTCSYYTKGVIDGIKYVCSEKYKILPPIPHYTKVE